MKALLRDLGRTGPGRAALLAWAALPQLGGYALLAALVAGAGGFTSLAAPVPATFATVLVLAAVCALAYRSAYRLGVGHGLVAAPEPGGSAGSAAAAAVVLGLPLAISLSVVAAVSAPVTTGASPVPPLALGVSWVCACALSILLAVVAPFALRRAALDGAAALRRPRDVIRDAAASPRLMLQTGTVTLAAVTVVIVFGPAAILALPLAVSIQLTVLDPVAPPVVLDQEPA